MNFILSFFRLLSTCGSPSFCLESHMWFHRFCAFCFPCFWKSIFFRLTRDSNWSDRRIESPPLYRLSRRVSQSWMSPCLLILLWIWMLFFLRFFHFYTFAAHPDSFLTTLVISEFLCSPVLSVVKNEFSPRKASEPLTVGLKVQQSTDFSSGSHRVEGLFVSCCYVGCEHFVEPFAILYTCGSPWISHDHICLSKVFAFFSSQCFKKRAFFTSILLRLTLILSCLHLLIQSFFFFCFFFCDKGVSSPR